MPRWRAAVSLLGNAVAFVTAWNYAGGITAKEDWYRGIWATPLPELRFF